MIFTYKLFHIYQFEIKLCKEKSETMKLCFILNLFSIVSCFQLDMMLSVLDSLSMMRIHFVCDFDVRQVFKMKAVKVTKWISNLNVDDIERENLVVCAENIMRDNESNYKSFYLFPRFHISLCT